MNNPGKVHYTALQHLVNYLAYTLWEMAGTNRQNLVVFIDSDWATNTKKCTSMTGMVLVFSRGAIRYKSKFQTVIAHSSTEAKFVAACDTAKLILFFWSLLQDLGMEQTSATTVFEDNTGALMMANAQQPTKGTHHIDIKHFALLDWVEQDLLILHDLSTHDNASDAMTKMLTKKLFYCHYDTYMGIRVPEYCARSMSTFSTSFSPAPPSQKHGDGVLVGLGA